MAADKSFSDIDLAEFQTPNRRASGLIKGAEAFHRISDEPEPEDAFMPALCMCAGCFYLRPVYVRRVFLFTPGAYAPGVFIRG